MNNLFFLLQLPILFNTPLFYNLLYHIFENLIIFYYFHTQKIKFIKEAIFIETTFKILNKFDKHITQEAFKKIVHQKLYNIINLSELFDENI